MPNLRLQVNFSCICIVWVAKLWHDYLRCGTVSISVRLQVDVSLLLQVLSSESAGSFFVELKVEATRQFSIYDMV